MLLSFRRTDPAILDRNSNNAVSQTQAQEKGEADLSKGHRMSADISGKEVAIARAPDVPKSMP